MSVTEADIDRWFTYHPPTPEQQQKYDRINAAARAAAVAALRTDDADGLGVVDFFGRLASAIEDVCPEGAERDEALERVGDAEHQALRRGGAGITRALTHLRAARMWANAAIACAAPSEAAQ